MKSINLFSLLFLFTAQCIKAQTVCDQFITKKNELNAINNSILQINNSLAHESRSDESDKQYRARRNSLVLSFQQKSKLCADLLERCMANNPGNAQTDLLRRYQIAKYYINAKDCGKAFGYLSQCKNHPEINSVKISDKPISKAVNYLFGQCSNRDDSPKEEYLNVTYGGKGMYYNLRKVDSVDSRPYSGDELEAFSLRALLKNEADSSVKSYIDLSTNGTVFYRFPFVLVAGPGSYQMNAVVLEKTVPASGDQFLQKPLDNTRLRELERIYNKVVQPAFQVLKFRYFDSVNFESVLPIYLAGGDFEQDSYNDFRDYCQKIHFRSCGPRVAYYSPYDKSIMAWMPYGGGTLVHEMVHAMMDRDFSNAPAWISEGIASMYEEVEPVSYKPKDNYRLYYVSTANQVFHCFLSLDKLFSLSPGDFNYEKASMLYSAYARYFSIYLQELGILDKFYKELRLFPDLSAFNQKIIIEGLIGKKIEIIQLEWETWLRTKPLPSKWRTLEHNIYEYIYNLKSLGWKCN